MSLEERDADVPRPDAVEGGDSGGDSDSDASSESSSDFDYDYEDLSDGEIEARRHNDAYRDIAHFLLPLKGRSADLVGVGMARLRSRRIHTVAQLATHSFEALVSFGVREDDAALVVRELQQRRLADSNPQASGDSDSSPSASSSGSGSGSGSRAGASSTSRSSGGGGGSGSGGDSDVQAKDEPKASGSVAARGESDDAVAEEFLCPVCLHFMLEPVTLLCGHSACRRCCAMALDLTQKCPAGCGRVLPKLVPEVNVALRSAIQRVHGDGYRKRAEEVAQLQKLVPVTYTSYFDSLKLLPKEPWLRLSEVHGVLLFLFTLIFVETVVCYTSWTYARDSRVFWLARNAPTSYHSNTIATLVSAFFFADANTVAAVMSSFQWRSALAYALFPVPTLCFRMLSQFRDYPLLSIVAVAALVCGLCVTAKAAHMLYKSRLLLQLPPATARVDTVAILLVTMLCNAVIGTAIVPFMWTQVAATAAVPIGVDVVYFALAAPLLSVTMLKLPA